MGRPRKNKRNEEKEEGLSNVWKKVVTLRCNKCKSYGYNFKIYQRDSASSLGRVSRGVRGFMGIIKGFKGSNSAMRGIKCVMRGFIGASKGSKWLTNTGRAVRKGVSTSSSSFLIDISFSFNFHIVQCASS